MHDLENYSKAQLTVLHDLLEPEVAAFRARPKPRRAEAMLLHAIELSSRESQLYRIKKRIEHLEMNPHLDVPAQSSR